MKTVDLRYGMKIVEVPKHRDKRGYFLPGIDTEVIEELLGRKPMCTVENISYSKGKVIRGMHWQVAPFQQGKLIRVLSGSIYDVGVVIDSTSKEYRGWEGVYIHANSNKAIWIPETMAHGFQVITNEAIVMYTVTAPYSLTHAWGFRWDDCHVEIKWPVSGGEILSEKDRNAPALYECVKSNETCAVS